MTRLAPDPDQENGEVVGFLIHPPGLPVNYGEIVAYLSRGECGELFAAAVQLDASARTWLPDYGADVLLTTAQVATLCTALRTVFAGSAWAIETIDALTEAAAKNYDVLVCPP